MLLTKCREAHHSILFFGNPSTPPDDDARVRLSKSTFMAGVQCLKRLYLQVYQPELARAPDESALATVRQGQEVDELARTTVPKGPDAGFAYLRLHGISEQRYSERNTQPKLRQ
jgi:hypothetical protein